MHRETITIVKRRSTPTALPHASTACLEFSLLVVRLLGGACASPGEWVGRLVQKLCCPSWREKAALCGGACGHQYLRQAPTIEHQMQWVVRCLLVEVVPSLCKNAASVKVTQ